MSQLSNEYSELSQKNLYFAVENCELTLETLIFMHFCDSVNDRDINIRTLVMKLLSFNSGMQIFK